ncbi:pyridoxal-phosphate dependent enzyme [Streptomyces sp. J2-1]|uniref:threonine ammonia-lyase n=1 Tax=Streptomyces corallincola TaxID=2851888 RepID=UPI001C3881B3|nr:pyridoxal-phosphate dependent enzyme [Streptomyces corallincola]MBV2354039.1 pyridoxal-phosphate dependent enzyme [Streptomyces corallincola]
MNATDLRTARRYRPTPLPGTAVVGGYDTAGVNSPLTDGGPGSVSGTGTAPAPSDSVLGHADLLAAAARIAPYAVHTPLLPGPRAAGGPRVLLKAEHLQPAGSFKVRGAANAVLALGADRVVTGSSGNHGIALARLAGTLGFRLTVVLAAGAAPAKAAAIRGLGAETVTVGGGVAEREDRARELAARSGAVLIPSSDHPLVVAGQGTVGTEILTDAPDTETVYVPVGGGGLLAGVCLAAQGRPVRVVGVEPAGTPRYARSLAAGHPVRLPPGTTVADGLRGQYPGTVTYPVVRDRVDELIAVGDAEILAAAALLHRLGTDAEPSGAVALAGALRAGRREHAVAVVSGGNTPDRLHTLRTTTYSEEHTS